MIEYARAKFKKNLEIPKNDINQVNYYTLFKLYAICIYKINIQLSKIEYLLNKGKSEFINLKKMNIRNIKL